MIGTCSRHYPPTRIEVTHLTRAKFIQRDKIFRRGQSREVERNWFDKLVYSLIYILCVIFTQCAFILQWRKKGKGIYGIPRVEISMKSTADRIRGGSEEAEWLVSRARHSSTSALSKKQKDLLYLHLVPKSLLTLLGCTHSSRHVTG